MSHTLGNITVGAQHLSNMLQLARAKHYPSGQAIHGDIDAHLAAYTTACEQHGATVPWPSIHSAFQDVQDDFRSMPFKLHSNMKQPMKLALMNCDTLALRVRSVIVEVALSVLQGTITSNEKVAAIGDMAWYHKPTGILVTQWSVPKAAKRLARSFEAAMTTHTTEFNFPLMVTMQVVGRVFSGTTVCPVKSVSVTGSQHPLVEHYLLAMASTYCNVVDPAAVAKNTRVAFGLDGRSYIVDPRGILCVGMRLEAIQMYTGPNEPARISAFGSSPDLVEACADDLVARAEGTQIESVVDTLHRHGLSLQSIHEVHAELNRRDLRRASVTGCPADPNLEMALTRVVSETIARVFKVALHQRWSQIDVARRGSTEYLSEELAEWANAMLDMLFVDKHKTGEFEVDQVSLGAVAKEAGLLFPKPRDFGKLQWRLENVDAEMIALQMGACCGLYLIDGYFQAAEPRVLRYNRPTIHFSRIQARTGRHEEALKRTFALMNVAKQYAPWAIPHLTLNLADQNNLKIEASRADNDVLDLVDVGESWQFASDVARKTALFTTNKFTPADIVSTPSIRPKSGVSNRPAETPMRSASRHQLNLLRRPSQAPGAMASSPAQCVVEVDKFVNDSIMVSRQHNGPECPSACLTVLQRITLLIMAAERFNNVRIQTFLGQAVAALESLVAAGSLDMRYASYIWLRVYDAQQVMEQDNSVTQLQLAQSRRVFIAKVFGRDSVACAAAKNEIGLAYVQQGEWKKAKESFRTALDEVHQQEPEHPSVFVSANNLAFVYYCIADQYMPKELKKRKKWTTSCKLPEETDANLRKAEELWAFLMEKRALLDRALYADVLNNYGSLLMFRRRFSDAVDKFEASLKLTQGLYEDGHPNRSLPIHNSRMCYKKQMAISMLYLVLWVYRHRSMKVVNARRAYKDSVVVLARVGRGFRCRKLLVAVSIRKFHVSPWQISCVRTLQRIGRAMAHRNVLRTLRRTRSTQLPRRRTVTLVDHTVQPTTADVVESESSSTDSSTTNSAPPSPVQNGIDAAEFGPRVDSMHVPPKAKAKAPPPPGLLRKEEPPQSDNAVAAADPPKQSIQDRIASKVPSTHAAQKHSTLAHLLPKQKAAVEPTPPTPPDVHPPPSARSRLSSRASSSTDFTTTDGTSLHPTPRKSPRRSPRDRSNSLKGLRRDSASSNGSGKAPPLLINTALIARTIRTPKDNLRPPVAVVFSPEEEATRALQRVGRCFLSRLLLSRLHRLRKLRQRRNTRTQQQAGGSNAAAGQSTRRVRLLV